MAYGRAEVLSISDRVVLYRRIVQQVDKSNSELGADFVYNTNMITENKGTGYYFVNKKIEFSIDMPAEDKFVACKIVIRLE